MHKRTAHRWRLFAIIGIGLVFALGSFWLVQLAHNAENEEQAVALRNEPDYIIDKFSFVRMTPGGQPHYLIAGASLTHRLVDDTSEVEQPFMQSVTPGLPPLTLRARHAHIKHDDNVVQLSGAVDVERPASPGAQRMTLKTERLTVLPDEDRMQTDAPVAMTLGQASISGKAMRANNATRQLHMAGSGHIIYPPRLESDATAEATPATAPQP